MESGRLTRLTAEEREDFGLGASLLGCGGGGRVDYLATALAIAGDTLDVEVRQPEDFLPGPVAVVGLIGSTMIMEEKIPNGTELPQAIAALERWAGEQVRGVVTAQIGGATSMQALLVAHQTGLPLIDADFRGSATPRLDQLSLFVSDLASFTAAAVTSSGLTFLATNASAQELEAVWRGTVVHSGGWAAFAIGPIFQETLQSRAIAGSLSRAVVLGRDLRAASDLASFAAAHGGRVVTTGRIINLERLGDALSFVHNHIVMLDSASGAVVRIEAGSEYLLVVIDGEPITSTPSIIALLDPLTRQTIAVDDLRLGMTVALVVLPGAQWWREDDQRLAKVSPRSFGIDFDVLAEVNL